MRAVTPKTLIPAWLIEEWHAHCARLGVAGQRGERQRIKMMGRYSGSIEDRMLAFLLDQDVPDVGTDTVLYAALGNGRVKIGISSKLQQRLGDLARSHGYPLRVLGVRECSGRLPRALEEQVKGDLARFNFDGEWFYDCPPVREYCYQWRGLAA